MSVRSVALVAAALIALALAGAGLYWALRPAPPPLEDQLVLAPARFADLAGWADDEIAESLPAFRRSCERMLRQPDGALGGDGYAGDVADWRPVCAAAAALPAGDSAMRAFLEAHFQPVLVRNNDQADGLFTGYFEASLNGSRRRHGRYRVALYRRPADLVSVDLGLFRDEFKGRRIAGRVDGGALKPYPDRTAINLGALADRGLEILWVDDPIDAFFLHIQGSGLVELDDGEVVRIGYAGQNGRPYVAIGGPLIAAGAIAADQMSMQAIRDWLADNPGEAEAMMRRNPAYVFFRELAGDGPIGAQGAVLTPGRSLAVDRRWHALGVPIWLDGMAPDPPAGPTAAEPLRRLMVAQDTGGAIRGPVRGDVFWGHGKAAAAIAGRMQHPGRIWLLLPRPLAARLAPSG